MRLFFSYILVFLGICANVSAQDAFYYFGTEKIPLTQIPGKIVVRTSLSENAPTVYGGMCVTNMISDSRQRLMVCETDAMNESVRKAAIAELSVRGAVCMPCYNDAQGLELWPTGYVSVKLKSSSDISLLQSAAKKYGLDILEQDQFMPLWYLLQCGKNTGISPVDAANGLQESGDFAAASPDFSFSNGSDISYDPYVHKQWGLYNASNEGYDINVSPAWNYATGQGVKVAVVDGGFDIHHKDLAENIYTNYDVVERDKSDSIYIWSNFDDQNHGTRCAGIIAAVRNNGINITGVAPDAKLLAVSSLPDGVYLADAINWAWKNGADIISCSWHCDLNPKMAEALDSAIVRGRNGKGCIVVFSAGNNGRAGGENTITWPASYRKEIISVANIQKNGAIASDSSYGSSLFITAPGTGILTTVRNDKISNSKSGTSLAAPHVAGVAALILERNSKLSLNQVREILARTAKKIGKDRLIVGEDYVYDVVKEFGLWNWYCGYGLVDAYEAVLNTPRK